MGIFLSINFTAQTLFKPKNATLFQKTVGYITSKQYYDKAVLNRNWNSEKYLDKINTKIKNKEYLSQRINKLLLKAKESLGSFYDDDKKIIIPWSGGKDSSSLLALSLIFFPEKEYYLLTVINGLCENIHNPKIRLKKVLELISDKVENPKVKHIYIDNVKDIEDLAINTAFDDKRMMGCPAICSACKIIMEFSMASATKKLDAQKITMGYVNYQGMQDWPEQNPIQIKLLKEELKKVDIYTESPLYNVFKYPFDPVLLLAYLGFDFKNLKLEMKCSGGGLNPLNLNDNLFESFLKYKVVKVKNHREDMIGEILAPEYIVEEGFKLEKFKKLIPQMKKLKKNKDFTKGAFLG